MEAGNFTKLAEAYAKNRPDYSQTVLDGLLRYINQENKPFSVADVGAGTGIWSHMLAQRELEVHAVEPNDSMRAEGEKFTADTKIKWHKGTGEETSLEKDRYNWVTMASSFHWTQTDKALAEFHRILKPGGFLTVLWNPRNIQGNEFHEGIEKIVYDMVPELKRVSSGNSKHVKDYHHILPQTGQFKDVLFMESLHEIEMTKDRYLGAWRSVNDIQSQAGPERFEKIMAAIEDRIANLKTVKVPYRTRSWTAQRVD